MALLREGGKITILLASFEPSNTVLTPFESFGSRLSGRFKTLTLHSVGDAERYRACVGASDFYRSIILESYGEIPSLSEKLY